LASENRQNAVDSSSATAELMSRAEANSRIRATPGGKFYIGSGRDETEVVWLASISGRFVGISCTTDNCENHPGLWFQFFNTQGKLQESAIIDADLAR
jgi:hypothetical protein